MVMRVQRTYERVVTAPDITFSASDQISASATLGIFVGTVTRPTPNWDENNIGTGLAGPGLILPNTTGNITRLEMLF